MSGPGDYSMQPGPPGAGPPFAFTPVYGPRVLYPGPPGVSTIPVVLPPGVRPPHGPMFPGQMSGARPGMLPLPGQPQPVTLPRPGSDMPLSMMPHPSMSALHKSTSVYVGKIANSIDDSVMESLLKACGGVKSWKRQEDPETKQPKGFGFCEFEDAEGVLRALRLLSNMSIDDQELLVKSNSATQKYVEAFEREKEKKDREDKEEGERQVDSDEAKDNEVLEKIMAIISDREDSIKKAKLEQDTVTNSKERSDSGSVQDKIMQGGRKEREKELEFDRKRDRERREAGAKRKEDNRAYERELYELERVERRKQKERDREKERQRDVERERLRHVKADMDQSDSDDEKALWERRTTFRNSRHMEDRRMKRKQEEDWDTQDIEQEEEEIELKKRKQLEASLEDEERLEPSVQDAAERGFGGFRELHESEYKPNEDGERLRQGSEVDPNDPIMRAMMAEMAAPNAGTQLTMPPVATPPYRSTDVTQAFVAPPHPASHNNSALADVFGDDEEELPQRQLWLLNYSEDELGEYSGSPSDDPKAAVKRLMDSIPTSKDGVFAYPIKWDVHDPGVLGPNITKWVDKKISDLLGVEEKTLVSFVMQNLSEKTAPQDLLAQLSEVLDDEAEVFIVKLYRMVIFETEKLAAGF